MTKTQAISAMILNKIAEGMNVREAINAVCGEGRVEAMIDRLYDELRAKA